MKANRKLAHEFFDGQSILIFGGHRLDTLGSLAYDPCLYNHSQAMAVAQVVNLRITGKDRKLTTCAACTLPTSR